MWSSFRALGAVCLTSLLVVPAFATMEDETISKGEEIVKLWDKCDYNFGNMRAEYEVINRNAQGGESRRRMTLKMYELFEYDQEGIKSDGDYSVVAFTYPRDIAGTALLVHSKVDSNDDSWTYFPSLKRVKRISSANQSGNFAGTEFAYEDIASQEYKKFTYKWLRTEACGGDTNAMCEVVEQIPTYENSGYSKQISKYDGCRQYEIEYYDHKGQHVKTQEFRNYKQYLGQHWRGHDNTMYNHVTGRSTQLVIPEFVYRTDMRESDFKPDALRFVR